MRRRSHIGTGLTLASSFVVVLVASPLFAQAPPATGAARDIQENDEAHARTPDPEGIRQWLERRARTLDGPSGDRERGISVALGGIVPGSGFSGGIGYTHLNAFPRGLGFQLDGRVSHRRYMEFAAAIGFLNRRSSTVELGTADQRPGSLFNDSTLKEPGSALYVETRYRYYPQHSYYGRGRAARLEDRTDYALSGVSIEGVWHRQFTPTIGMSLRGGVLDLDVGSGTNRALVNFEERFQPAAVSGGLAQPRFVTYGAGIARDTRQHPAAPEDGTFLGIAVRRFAARGAPDLDFTRLSLDVRGYARPFGSRGVLAVRGLLSGDVADNGGPTPFYLQQYLGGGDTIRGLRSYRFQDQSLFVLTAEYRWRAHRYIDIVPFVDAGNTAPGLSRLTIDSLNVAPGIAIRARTDRRTLVRLEVARGPEGYRIIVGTGPSF